MRVLRIVSLVTILTASVSSAELSPAEKSITSHISAQSLEGHLSFVASDLLEGRDTPSPGLDLAAEYIASQFRRAGLEPGVNGSFFQSAKVSVTEPDMDTFSLTLENGSNIARAIKFDVRVFGTGSLDLRNTPVVKVALENVSHLSAQAVEGKALIVISSAPKGSDQAQQMAFLRKLRPLDADAKRVKAAAVIVVTPVPLTTGGLGGRTVVDAETAPASGTTLVVVSSEDWNKAVALLPDGAGPAVMSIHIPPPRRTETTVSNVIGVLRGSDPVLKDSFVLVTAHYDHLGVRTGPGSDHIYNGANDDGSGTVSVIELAQAMGDLEPRPKRSIVFMTYFGEEKGLLGSRYYGRHPVFPLDKTVADINLEQVGRTDEKEGPQVGTASITGFDFSDMTNTFVRAGEKTGVKVYRHPEYSDQFFGRSDNQALADLGIPAHTLCTAFDFADYHQVSDHWDRIDYKNMAKVDRMVAVAVLSLANSAKVPKWNESNPGAEKYVEAARKLHPAN